MKDYIVGLGEILFDCLPDGKKLGGAPANFAYHVSNFGLNGLAVSAIGRDEDGAQIKAELAPRGLAFHLKKWISLQVQSRLHCPATVCLNTIYVREWLMTISPGHLR